MTRSLMLGVTIVLLTATALAQTEPKERATRAAARPQASSTLRILEQPVPEVQFLEQPFDQVMDWITEFSRLNVVVRWQTLEDAGIKRDQPISIKVKNLRLSQVLWLIMNEAGKSEVKLAYRASGSLLVLSTAEDLNKEMLTKVYDVADLLIRPPQTGRPDFTQNSQGLGQQGGGGSGGLFGQQGQQGQNQQDYQQQGAAGNTAEMDKLIQLIQDTVEPDSWRANGGEGSIQSFRSLLIVHNSILVHQRLGGYVREDDTAGP